MTKGFVLAFDLLRGLCFGGTHIFLCFFVDHLLDVITFQDP